MRAKIITALFAVLIFGCAILNLLLPDKEFSETENRYLAGPPALTASALLDGSYMKDLATYLTDQFPARDRWVGLKTLTELALGKQDSGGVYFASDGSLIERFTELDKDRFQKNLTSVSAFVQYLTEHTEIRVQTMLAPVASGILTDRLPPNAPEVDQNALQQQAQDGKVNLVNVADALKSHAGEYIYYKTDHHWTSLGAYYAYQEWQKSLGKETKPLSEYQEEILSDAFFGTTYSKANLYTVQPDTITAYYTTDQADVSYNLGKETADSFYTRSYLEKKDKYSVFLNANQSETTVKGRSPEGGNLLLIKDSYANTLAQFALEDYASVHLLDLRYYKDSVKDYIQQNQITDVLILYNLKNFTEDKDVYALGADVK